jgi:hypothetical protein
MHYSQILAALAVTGTLAAAVPLQASTTGDVEALDKRFFYWDWFSPEKRAEAAALDKRFVSWDWFSPEKRSDVEALGKSSDEVSWDTLTNVDVLDKRFVY